MLDYVPKLKEIAPESNAKIRDVDFSLMQMTRIEFEKFVKSKFGPNSVSQKIIDHFMHGKQ